MSVILIDFDERYESGRPKTAELTVPSDVDMNVFLFLCNICIKSERLGSQDDAPFRIIVPWDFVNILNTQCFRNLEMKFRFGIQYLPGVKEATERYDYS